MNGNIRVGNLFGIPFYINPSWFIVLGLVTLSYGQELSRFPQLPGLLPWLLGLVTAILLFASVLAHELGHSVVAIAQGIKVNSITLFLFGGLAMLEKESKTPLSAFLVAIAGPAVSALLFIAFTTISIAVPLPVPLKAVVTLVGTINLVLALFNLIPGLPLDGGNILKAIVWKITGNANKGVVFAGRVGQAFGWLAIAIGLMGVLGITQFGSLWTLLIGWFLLQNAGRSAQSANLQEKLSHLTAREALLADSPIVSGALNLREFVNSYVIGKTQWQKFLVTDIQGVLIGVLKVEDLKHIPTSAWPITSVQSLTQPLGDLLIINGDTNLLDVVKLIEAKPETNQFAVVDEQGFALGLIEKRSIAELLQKEALARQGA
ncbi:MAG: site-2 protease family protein [Cyanobacteria bacterium P01_H01_bin.15]